jgi:hypothetical protein
MDVEIQEARAVDPPVAEDPADLRSGSAPITVFMSMISPRRTISRASFSVKLRTSMSSSSSCSASCSGTLRPETRKKNISSSQ